MNLGVGKLRERKWGLFVVSVFFGSETWTQKSCPVGCISPAPMASLRIFWAIHNGKLSQRKHKLYLHFNDLRSDVNRIWKDLLSPLIYHGYELKKKQRQAHKKQPGMVIHACDLSTQEAEAGILPWVPDQPGPCLRSAGVGTDGLQNITVISWGQMSTNCEHTGAELRYISTTRDLRDGM